MKVVRFHEFGGPELLRVEEVPDPVGDTLVDVVFESIGGEVGKRAFELLKDGVGRMVVFGYASGEPLDEIAEAHRALEARTTKGKLIARP